MTFTQIIGQTETKQLLQNMAIDNRVPHAQIFLGGEGCGKLATALAFSQLVLCRYKTGEGEACGRCSDCIKASKMIHPDIHYSYPTVGGKAVSTMFAKEWREAIAENPYMNIQDWLIHIKAENKQGNITKDECSDIIKKLGLKIFEGKYKILLMWLPEFLGKEGNRLLKLIEEPPENTLFILVAEDADKILNTILSRCQVIKFKPLEDAEIMKGLLEKKQMSEAEAKNIAHLANGNFNRALSLSEENQNDNEQLFLEWLRMCYLGKPKQVVDFADQFSKWGRENQKHFFDYGLFFMREYMVLRMTDNENIRLGEKEKATARNLTKLIDYGQIASISNILTDSAYHISRNANPKILITHVTIRMHHVLRKKVTA